ncbi:HIT family protein [Candidatus Woesearchaeota archaeon]|nr:HIT family protein [Candidatus Woesearchaeota archaeon]
MDNLSNMSPEEILELQKKNCIFCKIIAKEIPAQEIYSDDKVSVILDINPANQGHCLIMPKQHYQILPQIPDDLIGYLFLMAKRTSRVLLKALHAQGTTVFVANGAVAGQKAPHFMIHVIPRKRSDMLFQLPKNSINAEELEQIRQKLAARMAALTGRKPHAVEMQAKPEEKTAEAEPVKEDSEEPDSKSEEDSEKESSGKQDNKKKDDGPIDLDKITDLFG